MARAEIGEPWAAQDLQWEVFATPPERRSRWTPTEDRLAYVLEFRRLQDVASPACGPS